MRRLTKSPLEIRKSLATVCTECGFEIAPEELMRVDGEHVRCTKCGATFTPQPKSR